MEGILAFLAHYHPLSLELRAHLMSILKIKSVPKKDFLLTAGPICRDVCFILHGLLRCYHIEDGKEVSRWFMKDGDVIFSIQSFYNQIPSVEYIQALEDTTLAYITHGELQDIYNRFREFDRIGRLLTEKYYQLWDIQLSSILLHSASERYQWLCEEHAELVLRVPSKYIASYLGISELTLYKIRSNRDSKAL